MVDGKENKNSKQNIGEAVTEKSLSLKGNSLPSPSALPFLEQAKLINSNNFHLCGYGWFNITTEEFAYILELSSKGDSKGIKDFYERLSEERVG